MNQKIRTALRDMGHDKESMFAAIFDDAIVGVTALGRVIYDYDSMVRLNMKLNNQEEEAAIDHTNDLVDIAAIMEKANLPAPIIMHRLS